MLSAASGGAALPAEVAARFERITGKRIGAGWGMTETCPAGTSQPNWDGAPQRLGSVGLPLPGVELRIVSLDDPARVLPPGETGETGDPRAERLPGLLEAAGGDVPRPSWTAAS